MTKSKKLVRAWTAPFGTRAMQASGSKRIRNRIRQAQKKARDAYRDYVTGRLVRYATRAGLTSPKESEHD